MAGVGIVRPGGVAVVLLWLVGMETEQFRQLGRDLLTQLDKAKAGAEPK